jgi:hypothetical protein
MIAAPAEREILKPAELAAEWGVDHETVLGLIAQGQLKASNISKGRVRPRFLIKRKDVEEFLERRANRKTDPAPQPQPNKRRSRRRANRPAYNPE